MAETYEVHRPTFSIDDAIMIAVGAHRSQRDKGRPHLPYVTHPIRVMAAFDDPVLQAIAVLHDVLEDTEWSRDDLVRAGVPAEVIEAVEALTHRPGEPNADYWRRVKANPNARKVKIADIADNLDPARMALLPDEVAVRLRAKYAAALAVLGPRST